MKTIGNIIWFILCGLVFALMWVICGFLWCITVVGIPVGVQCFKLAGVALWPFGKEVVYGGGLGATLINILWIIFGGIELAAMHLVIGLIFCVTIVGIPFGLQCFKLAKLSLMPFGAYTK